MSAANAAVDTTAAATTTTTTTTTTAAAAAVPAIHHSHNNNTSNMHPSTLNLDDIFGDVLFTPDGDTVFLGEQPAETLQTSGEGDAVALTASKPTTNDVNNTNTISNNTNATTTTTTFTPVPLGGGLYTTQLHDPTKPAAAMGMAGLPNVPVVPAVPYKSLPQQPHQLQYTTTTTTTATITNQQLATNPKKRSAATASASSSTAATATPMMMMTNHQHNSSTNNSTTSERKMSEQQKSERRERNREHAKRSRIRKKFLLESLQQSVSLLKEENDKLRTSIRGHLGVETAESLFSSTIVDPTKKNSDGLLADGMHGPNKVLDDPDFSFIKALQTAQQNFVVTDPSLPDNPIVYASQGFLNLTGYTLEQILGRNCRFLQGPETDPKSVEKIRHAIEQGQDMSVCLLNYRVDGTTFWNQFFIAALRDAAGEVTNYVGVQCKVSDQYAATVTKQQQQQDDDNLGGAGDDGDEECDD